MENKIEIYTTADEATEIRVQFDEDTVWLTQKQMAQLFDKDVRTVNEHIKNILGTKELEAHSTIRNFRIVRIEGSRKVQRTIEHYNLDMIISVGYRVNSMRGIQFRQWATTRLKDYLVKGYAINEKRLAQKQQEVEYLKTGIRIIGRVIEDATDERSRHVLQETGKPIIDNDTLAALTLFIAVSKPEESVTVKRLIISILNRNCN